MPETMGGPSPEDIKWKKGIIADISEGVGSKSRDAGDSKLTEPAMEGSIWQMKNLVKLPVRALRNVFKGSFRRRVIAESQSNILGQDPLRRGANINADRKYGGGTQAEHDAEMQAITQRFTSEYDREALRADERKAVLGNEGEEGRIKGEIIALIGEYANGTIEADAFTEQKNRILYGDRAAGQQGLSQRASGFSEANRGVLDRGLLYADNLFELASQAREAVRLGRAFDSIKGNIDISIGNAKLGVDTEAKFDTVDKIVEGLRKTRIGGFLNETSLTSAIAIAGIALTVDIGNFASRSLTSKAAAWLTFGTTAVAGAGFAVARERHRLADARRQDMRERAMGLESDGNAPRRDELNEYRYDSLIRQATDLSTELKGQLTDAEGRERPLDEARARALWSQIVDIETRLQLGVQNQVDLIGYSKVANVERERWQLMEAKALAKTRVRDFMLGNPALAQGLIGRTITNPTEFQNALTQCVSRESNLFRDGDCGIDAKDRAFNKFRNWQGAKVGVAALLIGAAVGEVFHEVRHAINGDNVATPLRWLKSWLYGENNAAGDTSKYHLQHLTKNLFVKLPEGYHLEHYKSDPTHEMLRLVGPNGKALADNFEVNKSGGFGVETMDKFKQLGIIADTESKLISNTEKHVEIHSIKDWVHQNKQHLLGMHRIYRHEWMDNDTARKYDLNELRLDWGGVHGTGMDAHGNYVFNISRMLPRDSFHGHDSINVPQAVRDGKMFVNLSLSEGTQHYTIEVPVDPHTGNAIIPRTSEAGKLLFSNNHGHALFKGRFAEAAFNVGKDAKGHNHYWMAATHEGKGIENAAVPVIKHINGRNFTVTLTPVAPPSDFIPPPIIPIPFDKPLEPIKEKQRQIAHVEELLPGYGYELTPERRQRLTDLNKFRPDSKELRIAAAKYIKLDDLDQKLAAKIQTLLNSLDADPKPADLSALTNLIVEHAPVGEKVFSPEFYENSPFLKGINSADEIVIIMDDYIGDTVLTAPLIDVLEKYLAQTGQNKHVVIQAKFVDALKPYEEKYPNLKVVPYASVEAQDKRYIINARKRDLESPYAPRYGESQADDMYKDPRYAINLDWSSWQKEQFPAEIMKGRVGDRIYRTLPGMIARNMEVMLGQKLYENLDQEKFEFQLPSDKTQRIDQLRQKYHINGDYVVLSLGSSIRPKEYSAPRWMEVIQGLANRPGSNEQIVVIKPRRPEQLAEFDAALTTLPAGLRSRIVYVDEAIPNVGVLLDSSKLTITPDTGIGHLSAGLGKPTIMMYSVANPLIWSMPNGNLHRIFTPNAADLMAQGRGSDDRAWSRDNINRYITSEGEGLDTLPTTRVVENANRILNAA